MSTKSNTPQRHVPALSSEIKQEIEGALNMKSWSTGPDLQALYDRLGKEVPDAVRAEEKAMAFVRKHTFPEIADKNRGKVQFPEVQSITGDQIREVHRKLLFTGQVNAVSSILCSHDSLPLTISQIGLCTVTYNGDAGTYSHRIFKRDLKFVQDDPRSVVDNAIEARHRDSAQEVTTFSQLARRGLKAYSERAVLFLDKNEKRWFMGQGNPMPFELLNDYWTNVPEFFKESLSVLKRLVEHQRFIYIPRQMQQPQFATIGHALFPRQFLVLGTLEDSLKRTLERVSVPGETHREMTSFIAEYGSQVVNGVFRASKMAPPQMFYCHKDQIPAAVTIAVADSALQKHKGFPMLLDLGRSICQATFDQTSFLAMVQEAYSKANQPFRFF